MTDIRFALAVLSLSAAACALAAEEQTEIGVLFGGAVAGGAPSPGCALPAADAGVQLYACPAMAAQDCAGQGLGCEAFYQLAGNAVTNCCGEP